MSDTNASDLASKTARRRAEQTLFFLRLALPFVRLLVLLLEVALLLGSTVRMLLFEILQAVLRIDLVKAARPNRVLAPTFDMHHGFPKTSLDWGRVLL
jgi:hypothetical protein